MAGPIGTAVGAVVGAVAGGLVGLAYGEAAILAEWLAVLARRADIENLGRRLARMQNENLASIVADHPDRGGRSGGRAPVPPGPLGPVPTPAGVRSSAAR